MKFQQAVHAIPANRQHYFIITSVIRSDNDPVTTCGIEVVLKRYLSEIDRHEPKNSGQWLMD